MSYIETMVDPARLAALKTRAAHVAAVAIRTSEAELAQSIGAVGPIEQEIAREAISEIWAELMQRDYDHLVED